MSFRAHGGFPTLGVPFRGGYRDFLEVYEVYRAAEGLGFPNIRGTLLGVPTIGIIVYWRSILGPPVSGSYHIPERLRKRDAPADVFQQKVQGPDSRVTLPKPFGAVP